MVLFEEFSANWQNEEENTPEGLAAIRDKLYADARAHIAVHGERGMIYEYRLLDRHNGENRVGYVLRVSQTV